MLRLAARAASALALALVSTLALTTTPALADPPQPAATDIVGVGTAITEQLFNQLSTDYNAFLTAAGNTTSPRLYSWDTTGTTPITPKTGATSIYRPNTSNAGITALTITTSGTVDFARSTRGPQAGDVSSTVFVAMAKDAVSWAAPTGGHAPGSLTTGQLSDIYACNVTNWRQIDPALPDATIKPVLPIISSEVRQMFLRSVGLTGLPGVGNCVVSGVEENQGTEAFLHDPDVLVPYSVGRYVGQVYGGHARPGDEPGALVPRAVNGIAPVDTSNRQISQPFAATAFSRVLYNAVREAEWTASDAHGQALRDIFGRSGWICRTNGGAPLIRSYGFLTIPAGACGSTTHI
ncbi:substrate-binding domain-containing protein [Kitasatospora sp. NPDC056184]|uniref:substrate-binding domain-containing protein n=1 Tax=Kitasatospora sp. NPDC056184 TaxID=3345738 RepID=UPI0035D8406F